MYLIQVRHAVRRYSQQKHEHKHKSTVSTAAHSFRRTLDHRWRHVLTFLLHVLEGYHEIRQKAWQPVALCRLLLLRLLWLLLQYGRRTLGIKLDAWWELRLLWLRLSGGW